MSHWKGWKNDVGLQFVQQADQRTKVHRDHISVCPSHVQSGTCDESMGTSKASPLDTPCRLHVRSFRHRLADSDGICAKYLIDGLIHAGILSNDSPKEVVETRFSQYKIPSTEDEYTELEITLITNK